MSYATRDLSRDDASASRHSADVTQSLQRDIELRDRPVRHPKSKIRRDMMRALGICINGSFVMPPLPAKPGEPQKLQRFPPTITYRPIVRHGPAIKGGRCQRCIDVRNGVEPAPVEDVIAPPAPLPIAYVVLRLPTHGLLRRRILEMLGAGKTPSEIATIEGKTRNDIHRVVRHARQRGELA